MNMITEHTAGTHTLSIQASITQLEKAIDFVSSHAVDILHDTWKVELAVEEAIANIIEHGYGNRPGPVHIEYTAGPTTISIKITDLATAFNPAEYLPYQLPGTEFSVRGRGIHLMRSVMDHIAYQRKSNSNILTLTKRI